MSNEYTFKITDDLITIVKNGKPFEIVNTGENAKYLVIDYYNFQKGLAKSGERLIEHFERLIKAEK